jgi:hypothetical protein
VTLVPLGERPLSAGARPAVTVLCGTYNQQAYLPACLDAILAQRIDFDAEIVLHDDASTDGTTEVVRAYAQRHPRVIRAVVQPVRRYSPTHKLRLELLELARGDYVAICDGDDVWGDPLKLVRQRAFLEAHPEHVLSYHRACFIDGHGTVLAQDARIERANRDYTSEQLRQFACGWLPLPTVMHRNVALDCPPEFHLAPYSDNFLPVLLGAFGGAGFQGDIGPASVRRHPGSVYTALSPAERPAMDLQTHLQIASYLLRQGEHQNARAQVQSWLAHHAKSFLATLDPAGP